MLTQVHNCPPSSQESLGFKQRKNEVSKQFERLQADRGSNRYSPRSIACRNQADAITAKLLTEALARSAANDFEQATGLVAQAKELDPTFSEVYRVEAWIEAYGDRPAPAAEAYENALAIEPNSAPLRYWYGGFLLRMFSDAKLASEQLLIAETLDPEAPSVLVELARVEMYLGEYEEADMRLNRLLYDLQTSTRHQRMAFDTWIQVKLRSATSAFERGGYSESLADVRAAYDRFKSIPGEFHDERIFGTIRRAQSILLQLADKLSVSGLRSDVERCYQEIEALRFDPLLAIEQPFNQRGAALDCDDSDIGKRFDGIVERVNVIKRYGFIHFDDNKQIFFHFSELDNAIVHAKVGVTVTFKAERREGRICAVQVRPHQEQDTNPLRSGVIKVILPDKAFGFVTDTSGGDLFFHRTDVADDTHFESLYTGDAVTYRIGRNHKGPIATEIRRSYTNSRIV